MMPSEARARSRQAIRRASRARPVNSRCANLDPGRGARDRQSFGVVELLGAGSISADAQVEQRSDWLHEEGAKPEEFRAAHLASGSSDQVPQGDGSDDCLGDGTDNDCSLRWWRVLGPALLLGDTHDPLVHSLRRLPGNRQARPIALGARRSKTSVAHASEGRPHGDPRSSIVVCQLPALLNELPDWLNLVFTWSFKNTTAAMTARAMSATRRMYSTCLLYTSPSPRD